MLGAVQGVAEVVPVSSSAQLALLPPLLGWDPPDNRTAFAAALHAGSCVGLLLALRHDLKALTPRTAGLLAISAVPAAVVGAVGQDTVERRLGGPGPTAALLGAAGVLMWWADRRPQGQHVGPREALAAGAAQALALAPGVSRAGATRTALRALRVDREEAARFSLLMSLPITAGAAGLTVLRARNRPPVVPTLVAGVTSYGAARFAGGGSHRVLTAAALYRLVVAAAVAVHIRQERS